jgi:predicted small secreted protein
MKSLIALPAAACIVLVAGCNTIEGPGKDIERGGAKIQDTAREVKHKL